LLALPIHLALIAKRVTETLSTQVARAGGAYQTLDMDRADDLAKGSTNICLSLEALGHSRGSAQIIATARARQH
jgi:geranylgeranyl diphosphate synthase type II